MEKELLNLILFEIRELKGDMTEVKERLTNVENRLTNVEKDLSNIKKDLANVKKDLVYVKELAEFNRETCDSIKNVVTSFYMEFKKHIKVNSTQHKLYDTKLLKFNKEN